MSTTYTTNYHLGKQEDTSDNFNMSVITANMDTIDTVLGNKADNSTTYTKTEVDTSLGNKADKSTTYTKTEVDTALSGKQNAIDDLSTIRSGAALGATAVQPETGKGLSTNDYTTAEKTKLAGIAEGAEVNVQSNWTQSSTTADDYIKNKPTLGTAAAKNATDTYNATGTDVTTGKAVAAALATLPEPMVFKGSLGTGGTITTLPSASSSNKGYVYKVITAGTYASQSAKAGDTFISDGSAWVLIPSGDEPSGTVTNVAVANGGGLAVSGSPITSSGTITVGHSNSVTAKTSSSVKKFTYDAHGHVTGSSELSTAESDALASGIDSTKVSQIETNKNNIVFVSQNGAANYAKVGTNSYANNGLTVTVSNGEITISGTANLSFSLYISGTISDNNTSDVNLKSKLPDFIAFTGAPNTDNKNRMIFALYNGSTWVYSGSTNNLYHDLTDKVYTHWLLYIPIVSGNQYNGVWKPMIVPKTLYDSGFTNYQPYAMSNAELTAAEKQNENNILSVMMSGTAKTADLNNIAVNDFGVYTNKSSNLPSADYCFVRTSVNPEAPTTSRLQEAFVMSTGVSYVRTMGGGEWHNWLQITNT